jgi:hypothetical protein
MLDADEFLALDIAERRQCASNSRGGLAAEGFVSAKMGAKSSSFGVTTKTTYQTR